MAAQYCLVTAGPSYEPLDEVRRLTNFSTGSLGCQLSTFLSEHGYRVTLLLGTTATYQGECQADQIERFTTNADLQACLERHVSSRTDVVFHAAAVSDFAIGKIWRPGSNGQKRELHSAKLSTDHGTLWIELVPAAKIIMKFRDWWPKATLIGWKYEAEGSQVQVIQRAVRQITQCRTDACVANGPGYGEGFGLVHAGGRNEHFPNAPELFAELERMLKVK